MTDSHRDQIIESIVDDDRSVRYGDAAWRHEVEAISTVADTVRTTFGPYGHDKLVVDNGGNVEVTSETTSILRSLHLDDPVARMIRDVANSQLFTAGDGTTATVVLTEALVDNADELVEQGLHPTTIVGGYERAVEMATETLSDLAETYDITDREVCESVAETVLAGTNTSFDGAPFGPLVVDAVAAVTDGYDVDLNALRVRSDRGRGVGESELLHGAVVDVTPDDVDVSRIDGANVLFVDGAIEPMTGSKEATLSVETGAELQAVQHAQTGHAATVVDHLESLDVDVLVVDGVSAAMRRALSDAGIAVLASMGDTDLGFLLRALGARPVAAVDEAEAADVVTADIEFDHDETYTVFTTDDAGTVTLHLRSSSAEQLTELETTMDKAIEVVTHVATDGRVLPGGCAPEAAMAAAIRGQVASVKGREQLAVFAFADALESLPRALAHNAGLDATDQLLALRTAHGDGDRATGIAVHDGWVADMWDREVLDTLVAKTEMLSNAKQAVTTIVRIDGIVEAEPVEPRGENA